MRVNIAVNIVSLLFICGSMFIGVPGVAAPMFLFGVLLAVVGQLTEILEEPDD